MGSSAVIPPPPPGFVLDGPGGSVPPPPPGFVLDRASAAPQPSLMDVLGPLLQSLRPQFGNVQADIGFGALQGLGRSMRGLGELTGLAQPDPVADAAFQPQTLWQSGGQLGEQTLEMLGPGAAALKAVPGAGLLRGLARTGLDATGSAAVGKIQGSDPALAAGATVAGRAVGGLATAAGRVLPAGLVNSVIKPLEKEFRFGRNPGRAVAEEGITGTSGGNLLENINARLQEVGESIGQTLRNLDTANQPSIDLQPMLKPLQEAAEKALRLGDKGLAARLLDFADAPIFKEADLLTPLQAAEIKRMIGESTKWTGEAFDASINQAKASVYRLINDAVSDRVPGVRALQDRYANLLSASKSMERTLNVSQRGAPVNLMDVATVASQADPVSGIGAALVRRGATSTPALTTAAQVARTGQAVDPILTLLRALGLANLGPGGATPTTTSAPSR